MSARTLFLPGGHGEYLGEITFKKETKLPELAVELVKEFLDGE